MAVRGPRRVLVRAIAVTRAIATAAVALGLVAVIDVADAGAFTVSAQSVAVEVGDAGVTVATPAGAGGAVDVAVPAPTADPARRLAAVHVPDAAPSASGPSHAVRKGAPVRGPVAAATPPRPRGRASRQPPAAYPLAPTATVPRPGSVAAVAAPPRAPSNGTRSRGHGAARQHAERETKPLSPPGDHRRQAPPATDGGAASSSGAASGSAAALPVALFALVLAAMSSSLAATRGRWHDPDLVLVRDHPG
jgi:hypothetical protein